MSSNHLQVIEGIGPKMEQVLKENGISNWSALAASSGADLKVILDKYGDKYKIINPHDWPQQARFAMNGDWNGLVSAQKDDGSQSKAEKMLDTGKYPKAEKMMDTGENPKAEKQSSWADINMSNGHLQVIEGIGPKMEGVLKENGISNWSALAASSGADLKVILDKYGDKYKIIDPNDWPQQARFAMNGDWNGLVSAQKDDGSPSKAEKMLDTGKYPKAEKMQDTGKSTAEKQSGWTDINMSHGHLQVIEGIGPKMEGVLKENGISNWSALAGTSGAGLKVILDKYGDKYKIIDPNDWPRQARFAMNGDWNGLVSAQKDDGSPSKAEKMLETGKYPKAADSTIAAITTSTVATGAATIVTSTSSTGTGSSSTGTGSSSAGTSSSSAGTSSSSAGTSSSSTGTSSSSAGTSSSSAGTSSSSTGTSSSSTGTGSSSAGAGTASTSDKDREDDYLICSEYENKPVNDKVNNVALFKHDNGQFYFALYNKDGSVRLRSEGFRTSQERDQELSAVLKYKDDKSLYERLEPRKGYYLDVLRDKDGREVGRSCLQKVKDKKVAPVKAAPIVATAATAAALAIAKTPKTEKNVVETTEAKAVSKKPKTEKKVVKTTEAKAVSKTAMTEKKVVGTTAAKAVATTSTSSSGFKWWWLLPLLLIPLFFLIRGCDKDQTSTPPPVKEVVKEKSVEQTTPPPPVEKEIKEVEKPVEQKTPPPAVVGCNCNDLVHPVFKIPAGPAPKTTTRLGLAPEYGNSHSLDANGFYNKLNQAYQSSNAEKRFLDGIFRQMGYNGGWKDATPTLFSSVTVPRGSTGNLGTKATHQTVHRKLDPTNSRDLEAFKISAKNKCDLHFMKTCGNHFFIEKCK